MINDYTERYLNPNIKTKISQTTLILLCSLKAIERSLAELNYKQPANGNLIDSKSEILKELGAEEIDDKDNEDTE